MVRLMELVGDEVWRFRWQPQTGLDKLKYEKALRGRKRVGDAVPLVLRLVFRQKMFGFDQFW